MQVQNAGRSSTSRSKFVPTVFLVATEAFGMLNIIPTFPRWNPLPPKSVPMGGTTVCLVTRLAIASIPSMEPLE